MYFDDVFKVNYKGAQLLPLWRLSQHLSNTEHIVSAA